MKPTSKSDAPMTTSTVLITGGAGGLGRVAADYLARKGFRVIAADNNQDELEKVAKIPGVTTVPLDITNQSSVNNALGLVKQLTDGLDGIVNLAGILIVGSMAELPAEKIRQIFDINVLGLYRVNKTFLPLVIKKHGRIINISSETGWQTAAPFNGPYAMSKYALEAYSDALRRELALLGIKVIKIRPGPFKSAMTASIQEAFRIAKEDSELFSKNLHRGMGYTSSVHEKANDPVILARILHKALTVSRPRIVYRVKQDKLRSLLEILPLRWADKVFKKVME